MGPRLPPGHHMATGRYHGHSSCGAVRETMKSAAILRRFVEGLEGRIIVSLKKEVLDYVHGLTRGLLYYYFIIYPYISLYIHN